VFDKGHGTVEWRIADDVGATSRVREKISDREPTLGAIADIGNGSGATAGEPDINN
jgi:hypothetical protein